MALAGRGGIAQEPGRVTGPDAVPPPLVPPRIAPPARALGALAFLANFVRNPLAVVPRAAYEEDFVRLSAGSDAFVCVTAPEMIRTVLHEERGKFRKLSQIRLLGPLLGKGILTSEGADWKWQRQAAAPMFRHQDLLGFTPAFVRAAERVLARWRKAGGVSVQEVDRDMTRATFDVVCATLLPTEDAALGTAMEKSIAVFQRSAGWGMLYAALGVPPWLPRPGMIAGLRAVALLRGAAARMLRERRAAGAGADDLMDRLTLARDPETAREMNAERLVDNLLTFYLAGHETTAKALTWTLYLLARSPQWAERLREEVARVTGGAPVAGGHIERLSRVQQVLKESMRLYPPVPIMSRQAVADVRLGAHEVRAGTSVLVPIYAVHRHARRWDRPDEFDPERFAPAAEAAIPRCQYMPFGAGPRICIGMAFAMIEAVAILATLLRAARFAPLEGREPVPVARVTLLPRGGMPLRVSLSEA
jgi:cytochrome P450